MLPKLCFPIAVVMACSIGCAASRTQMTTQVHRPLEGTPALGQVAVVSVVSAEKSKSWHAKQAAEVRKSLQECLERNQAVHVVESHELLPQYADDRSRADTAALVQYACGSVRGMPVDTICLVQLKDGGGEVVLGIGVPAELVSVRGKCDYELRLIDVHTGRELFCSTGTWSERTDMPKWPLMPSPAHFGAQLAQAMQPAAPHDPSLKLATQQPVPAALAAVASQD
jgi:hypothetical protein